MRADNLATEAPRLHGRMSLVVLCVLVPFFVLGLTCALYLWRHQAQAPGSYAPLFVGSALVFASVASAVLSQSNAKSVWFRIGVAAASGLLASVVFLVALLGILLNTIGA